MFLEQQWFLKNHVTRLCAINQNVQTTHQLVKSIMYVDAIMYVLRVDILHIPDL